MVNDGTPAGVSRAGASSLLASFALLAAGGTATICAVAPAANSANGRHTNHRLGIAVPM
jgi:hypothetical protein